MSFDVAANAYDRFMGSYADSLAERFVELISPHAGQTALDVGCGPGALTSALAGRVGSNAVSAVDPSDRFLDAVRSRLPGVVTRNARAEQLPFGDATFDLSVAQLVVHFMSDAAAGLTEMARVTKSGGTVAACVWDFYGDRAPVSVFWKAARQVRPDAPDESTLVGVRDGQLAALLTDCGLRSVEQSVLEVTVDWPSFDDWWQPFTFGVGPAGGYLAEVNFSERAEVKAHAQQLLPNSSFTIRAAAWAVTGRVQR